MERSSVSDKQTSLLSDSQDVLPSPTRQRLQQLPPPRLPIPADDEDDSRALDDNKWRPLTPLYGAVPTSPVSSSSSPPPPPSLSSLLVSRYQRRYSCLFLSLLLAAVLYYDIRTETTLIQSSFPPLLPAASLVALNNLTATQRYFGSSSLASNSTHRTRVVYFILDGLRADTVSYPGSNSSSALAAFLSTLPPADLLTFPLRNQLPTISISSWVCLVTGSTPSFHGRLGNDDTSLIAPIASVFSSASDFDAPSGLSGSGFWAILLSPTYSPFHGDGTIPDAVDVGDPHYRRGNSAAKRDAAYDRRLHTAIRSVSIGRGGRQSRFDYELFLAYYDDVDGESHSFGGSSAEAAEAVRAEAAYLQSAMQAVAEADRWSAEQGGVHWTTIYMLSSDHGHLDVGGHGGDAPNVHTVPVVVFSNQSGFNTRNTAAAFSLPPVPASYTPSTVDLATTIAALLGIPVPRESEGMFFPSVLAPFVASDPRRAFAHYVDLFMQKRAFVTEVANVVSQTQLLEADVFSAASLASLTAPPADGNWTRAIAALNSAVGETLQVLQDVQAARLRSELLTNWLLSSLLLFLLLLPLLCWWFNSRTFLSIRALFPQQLSAGCAHLSYLCRWCLVAAYRRVGGHAGVPFPVFYPLSPLTLRINRLCAALALCLTVLWLLLTLAEFFVVFRFGYRPDPQWSWQFTLFNSEFDAYVMLFGFCMTAAVVVCGALHLLIACALSSRRLTEAVVAFLDLSSVETASAEQSAASVSAHSVQVSVLSYCLVQYLSFFSCLFVLLFLYSQGSCIMLPTLSPINVITPGIWNARFQSVSIGCMLLPAVLYVAAASWWSAWRVHGHMWQPVRDGDREDDEGIKVRQQDSWRAEKEAVLRELARLRAPLSSQPLSPLTMIDKGEDSNSL